MTHKNNKRNKSRIKKLHPKVQIWIKTVETKNINRRSESFHGIKKGRNKTQINGKKQQRNEKSLPFLTAKIKLIQKNTARKCAPKNYISFDLSNE